MRLAILVVAVASMVIACTTEEVDQGFKDVSSKISENGAERRYGVAVRHNDRKPEAFVTGFGAPNQLLRWQNGMLRDITPEPLQDPNTDAIGAAWCDVDQDGLEELYVLTTDTYGGRKRFTDHLYDQTQDGWTDLFEDSDVPNRYAGRSVACHYSPEGYAFFVARYGGPMQLITEQDGELTDLAPRYGMDKVTGGRSIVNIPTPDGVDLFAGNERGPNFYYERQNDTYEERADELGVFAPLQNARGVATIDIEKDDKLDLVVGNWNDYHRLYKRADQEFQDIAPTTFNEPTPVRSVIAHDFDGDGSEEIFLNNIDHKNSYHESKGSRAPIGEAEEPNGAGTGAAIADFNQDGHPELLIAHGESKAQPMSLYTYSDAGHHSVVRPTWKDGSPARNARVIFKDAGGVAAIDGGSAYLNQMAPAVYRGGVEKVTIQYPHGESVTTRVTEDSVIQGPKKPVH
mgnify:CR=1 FL=1